MVWIGPGSLRERVVWGLQEKSDGKAKSGLERVRQELNKTGLWKHGAEQMLAEAGMQN